MARLRKYPDRTSTAIRFTTETHDRLETAANERDLSINYLVNRAVEDFLDRLIPVDEWSLTRDTSRANGEVITDTPPSQNEGHDSTTTTG